MFSLAKHQAPLREPTTPRGPYSTDHSPHFMILTCACRCHFFVDRKAPSGTTSRDQPLARKPIHTITRIGQRLHLQCEDENDLNLLDWNENFQWVQRSLISKNPPPGIMALPLMQSGAAPILHKTVEKPVLLCFIAVSYPAFPPSACLSPMRCRPQPKT